MDREIVKLDMGSEQGESPLTEEELVSLLDLVNRGGMLKDLIDRAEQDVPRLITEVRRWRAGVQMTLDLTTPRGRPENTMRIYHFGAS
jgi:hypothetical protein